MAARMSPGKRAQSRLEQEKMSRADSLASMSEFGKVLTPSQQLAVRKKAKVDKSVFGKLRRALGGK